jgi:uncharacterized membrane protein YczE
MLILLFSIALHLKVKIAVHPLDVFLGVLQDHFNSVKKGTYLTYLCAFFVATFFGIIYGRIEAIQIGTVITITSSGFVMDFYNRTILQKWKI